MSSIILRSSYCFSVGVILAITASFITAYAAEKNGNNNAKKAVVANQSSPAQQIFEKMSPDELRDPLVLDNFIRQYPDSNEARVAFALRYLQLKNNPSIDDFNKFIEQYPDKLQTQIALGELFDIYLKKKTVPGLYDFISQHPDTIQTWVAIHHIEQRMFEFAKVCNTEEGYDAFIEAFPDAPQVRLADDNAKNIAIESEQKEYAEFLKTNPQATEEDKNRYVNTKVSLWSSELKKIWDDRKYNPDIINEASYKLRVLRWERRYDVLIKVYGNSELIQNIYNAAHISDMLAEINNTLKKNHEELLKKLDEQTVIICNEICEKLDVLHKDNQQIIEKLQNGFNRLHADLRRIHKDLGEIQSTLNDMNRQLHIISETLTAIATGGGSAAISLSGYGFNEVVKQISDRNADSNVPFSESQTMTTVSCIAQNGYEDYPNVWESNEAAEIQDKVDMYFQKIDYGSPFARYIGALAVTHVTRTATKAATKYVSEDFAKIVEDLSTELGPLLAKETTFTVENLGIPTVNKVVQKVKEAGEFQWVFIGESTKETYENFKVDFWEYQKVVVPEEENNILEAVGTGSDAAGIDRKWSNPVIAAIKKRDVNEMVIPWAENFEVKPEIIEFYKKYLKLTSEE